MKATPKEHQEALERHSKLVKHLIDEGYAENEDAAGSSEFQTALTLPTFVPVETLELVQSPFDSYDVAYSRETHQETAEEPINCIFHINSFPG